MDTDDFSIKFGKKIKRLRQNRDWSQGQLAQKLKIHQKQISKYERGMHIPSFGIAVNMARVFNVSLDYIAFDECKDANQLQIADRELIQKLNEVNYFSEQDKATLKDLLDIFITKTRFQRVASESEMPIKSIE